MARPLLGWYSAVTLLFLENLLRLCNAQDVISVWTNDTNGALDVEKDVNLNISTITQRFMNPKGTTVDVVISNNDVRYFLATNGNIGSSPRISFLSSTLVMPSNNSVMDSYVLYQTTSDKAVKQIILLNRTISLQRVIPSDFNPKSESLLVPNLNDYRSYNPMPADAEINCLDARTIDTLNVSNILILCKASRMNLGKKMAKIVAISYLKPQIGVNSSLLKTYFSEEYENDKPTFETVSWGVYSRSTSANIADTLEGIVLITELVQNGANKNWVMFGGAYVTLQNNREFNISKMVYMNYSLQVSGGGFSVTPLTQKDRVFVTTVSNTFTLVAGTRTSRNVVMVGFTQLDQTLPGKQNISYLCWEDSSATNSLLDKLITNETTLTSMNVKCGPQISGEGFQSMGRVAKLANDSDFFLRVSFNNLTKLGSLLNVSISYSIIKVQPVRINVASMTIPYIERRILNNTILVPEPFTLYPIITSAVDSKVFYTCWRDYSQIQMLENPCIVMDYFWVNLTAYNDANDDTILSTFPLMKREMGPFSTVAIDFDSATNTSYQMAMVPEFKPGSTMVPLAKKVISIYNLTRAQFSIIFPPAPSQSDSVNIIEYPDIRLADGSQLTQKISYQNGSQNVWLNYGTTTMWIPFKDSQPMSIGYFRSNMFFKDNSPIALQTTESGIKPNSIRFYRFELTATPSQTNGQVLLVDRIWVEFYTKDSSYFVHTRSFNIKSDPMTVADPKLSIANSWPLGTWSSTNPLFQYANLKKVENFPTGGVFCYFQSSTSPKYGVVRMDVFNPKVASFRTSENPILMYETKSTVIILTITDLKGPVLQLQQLDDAVARNISANVSAITKTIGINETGPELRIKRPEDINLEIYNTGQTVAVNILAEVEVPVGSSLSLIVASRISWTNRTTGISTANFLEIEYQKALELPFSAAAKENFRCIYNTSVVFLELDSTNKKAFVHVYNLTRWSYFSQVYLDVTVLPTMKCMGEIVAVTYKQGTVQRTDLITLQGELRAVNRIRDSTLDPNSKESAPFAFSRWSTGRSIDTNKFLLVQNELTNVYISMNYPVIIPNLGETIRPLKPLMIQGFRNSDLVLKDISMETYLLVKPQHIQGPAVYIGNETLDAQKKILYESNVKQTYKIESSYKIPTSFFDVNMVTSDSSKIQVLKRIREIKNPYDLWSESTESSTTNLRCNFSLRGIEDISIMNDVMLRVDSRDDGFCMEISRISIGDSLSIQQSDYMIQQGGSVSDCRLVPDKSFTNSTGWDTVRSTGGGLNFAITCIYSEKEKSYFWALFINVQKDVQNIFKPKTNLLRMEIKHKFTYYKATLVNNYIYFGFYDASSRKTFYIRDLINTLNLDSPIIEQTHNSTGFELGYLPPSTPGERPQTGIWMLFVNITLQNSLESYNLSTMRVQSNGTIISSNALTSADNSLRWSNPLLNQSISNISCAGMTYSNTSTNLMACAYTFHSSRNVMFYSFAPSVQPDQLQQNYVAPYADFEIRQLKVFFWDGVFSYIILNFSPTTGKKYLIMYRHDLNRTSTLLNVHNASVYLNSPLLMHGTIDLTNTSMDLNNVEINYFTLGTTAPKNYIGIHDDKFMRIFEVTNLEVTIDSNIQFSQISNSKISYVDHMGTELTSYLLSEFFREKKGFSMLFVWVLLASFGLAGLLVALYMTFKKKPKIDESQVGLKELRNMGHDKKDDLNCSINLETGY